MTKEDIEKQIQKLKDFLETKPIEEVYMGDGDNGEDWVDMENSANDRIEQEVKAEIKRLEKLLSKLVTNI